MRTRLIARLVEAVARDERGKGTGMRMRQSFGAFAALVAVALALAACGANNPTAVGSGPAATGAATAAATTEPAPTAAATAPAAASPGDGAAGYGGDYGDYGYGTTAGSPVPPATPATVATAAAAPAGAAAAPAASGGGEKYTIVPDASKARYKVDETFFGRGLSTAVGTTSAIAGDLYLDRQRVSASRIDTITVDISRLTSDSSQRDNRIRRSWLESSRFPQATFVTKRLEGLPDAPYAEGQELTFKIVGDLTVRTVTKEVTWDARGKIVGDTFTGTATTNFNMTDFGFEPPEIAGTLKAENGVIVELELQARRAS